MDKISKALKKFNTKEQKIIKEILQKIKNNSYASINVEKLKKYHNIYRVRKGKIRIIFKINEDKNIFILAIERRNDKTYNI